MTSVVVVGGGLSGLTAAWRLRAAGWDVTVVEGRARTGGVLLRGAVDNRAVDNRAVDNDGHARPSPSPTAPVIDLGAESMLARRPEAIALARELGLGDDLEPPAVARPLIWSRGVLIPMPSGHLMGVPGSAESVAGVLTAAELDRLRAGLAASAAPLDGDVSVGGWLSDRLGPAVVDRLVEPLLGGVYAGRVHNISLQAAIPALWPVAQSGEPIGPAVQRLVAASAGAGAPFTGLRGGVARLAEALAVAARDAGITIRLGTSATGLIRTPDGWSVTIGPAWRPETLSADAVLLAVPAPAAAKLLASVRESPDTSPAPPQASWRADIDTAASHLGRIELASMALVAITVPAGTLASISSQPSSGVLVPSCEGRLVKAITFTSSKWAWAAGDEVDVLRLSVGRAGEADALQRSDDNLADAAVTDAGEILGLDLPVQSRRVVRWGGGLPQYAPGHLDLVASVRAALARVDGLEACGAAFDGVGIAACIASATAASARLSDRR